MDAAGLKDDRRAAVFAARRALGPARIAAAREAVCAVVLATVAARGWHCVAAYDPLRTEPGSVELLEGLLLADVDVLVPLTLADDLDWAWWPSTTPVGPEAITRADAVFVPALAVDRRGVRLGRGRGFYDRALPRVTPGTPLIALLHNGELVDDDLPGDTWDVPVTAAVTPQGWFDL